MSAIALAKWERGGRPWVVCVKVVELRATTVGPRVCAPAPPYWTVATFATPSGSVADRFTATLVWFQPAALGAGGRAMGVMGGVLSIRITWGWAASVLPALSVAE